MKKHTQNLVIVSLAIYGQSILTMESPTNSMPSRIYPTVKRYAHDIPDICRTFTHNAFLKLQLAKSFIGSVARNAMREGSQIYQSWSSAMYKYVSQNPRVLHTTWIGIAALSTLRLASSPLGRYIIRIIKESCIKKSLHSGNLTLIRCASTISPDRINATDERGRTVVHQAAMHNRHNIIKFLIEKHAGRIRISEQDKASYRPIHYAAAYSGPEVIQCLIDAGEDIDRPWGDGAYMKKTTPFDIALHRGRLDMVRYLVQHGAKIGQTDQACYNRNYSIDKYLSQVTGNVDMLAYDDGVLEHAIYTGNYDEAKVALERNAKMIRASAEQTPLFRCIREPDPQGPTNWDNIALLLIEMGAPLHYIDEQGNNIIFRQALDVRNMLIINRLLQHGIGISGEQRAHYEALLRPC